MCYYIKIILYISIIILISRRYLMLFSNQIKISLDNILLNFIMYDVCYIIMKVNIVCRVFYYSWNCHLNYYVFDENNFYRLNESDLWERKNTNSRTNNTSIYYSGFGIDTRIARNDNNRCFFWRNFGRKNVENETRLCYVHPMGKPTTAFRQDTRSTRGKRRSRQQCIHSPVYCTSDSHPGVRQLII